MTDVALLRLEIARLRRRQRRELAAVGLDVEQRRFVEAIEAAHQDDVALDPTNFTIEVPIGLGRTGERSENVPRVFWLFFGLCSTRSRRDWCSQ